MQADDTQEGPKRRGRKPKGSAPMSAAEKQRGYRERQKVRRIEQLMRPGEMSRVTLISGLGYCLAALDDPETSAVMRETFQGNRT